MSIEPNLCDHALDLPWPGDGANVRRRHQHVLQQSAMVAHCHVKRASRHQRLHSHHQTSPQTKHHGDDSTNSVGASVLEILSKVRGDDCFLHELDDALVLGIGQIAQDVQACGVCVRARACLPTPRPYPRC